MPYDICFLTIGVNDANLLLTSSIMSRYAYDNTGNVYNATLVLNHKMNLDVDRYKAYSPLFIP